MEKYWKAPFMGILVSCITFCTAFSAVSCSSAPERPAEIVSIRGIGRTQLQLANKESDRGNYAAALVYLEEAWNCAVRADNPELRIKVLLSRGNVLLYQGHMREAEGDWAAALQEAEQEGKTELASAARIHQARGTLLNAIAGGALTSGIPEKIESAVFKEMANIKSEETYLALAWICAGLAEKEQGLWDKAEASLKNALKIHDTHNYLEQAAYDWYLIASVRSRAGKFDAAAGALREALSFDRRAENSYGLGCDWMALGDVRSKMGDSKNARDAYTRALEIFNSISMEESSAQVRKKLANIK